MSLSEFRLGHFLFSSPVPRSSDQWLGGGRTGIPAAAAAELLLGTAGLNVSVLLPLVVVVVGGRGRSAEGAEGQGAWCPPGTRARGVAELPRRPCVLC